MSVQHLRAAPELVGGVVQWKYCNWGTSKCANTAPYADTVVNLANDSGTHTFVIQIVNDDTGLDIQFAKNNPLWIGPNAKPTGPGVGPNDQIEQVSPGGNKVLTFIDKNKGDPMVLKYQLNFEDRSGNAVTAIDPEIKNGGGSTKYSLSALELVIAGAVLLAVGFFVRPLLRALFAR